MQNNIIKLSAITLALILGSCGGGSSSNTENNQSNCTEEMAMELIESKGYIVTSPTVSPTVEPTATPNYPPIVEAGSNQSGFVNTPITIAGYASDKYLQ